MTSLVTTLIGSLGFPIVLVIGLGLFIDRRFWPWYTKRQDNRDIAEDDRHKTYMEEMAKTRTVFESTVLVLNKLSTQMEDNREHSHDEHMQITQDLQANRAILNQLLGERVR